MWCGIYQKECYEKWCMGSCFCSPTNIPLPQPKQEYRYKCPCGGEFIEPISKSEPQYGYDEKFMPSYIIAYRTIYVCPFCGKEMVGIK
jgi:hypothetical protein